MLKKYIFRLSSALCFRDDWSFRECTKTIEVDNKNLSISSLYITNLTNLYYPGTLFEENIQSITTFNNPFWTVRFRNHISMKGTCEKIILVLIRCLTINTMNSDVCHDMSEGLKNTIIEHVKSSSLR